LLFDESGEGAGGHLVSYVRKTRSDEIVRLRAGMAQGFDVTMSSAFVLSDDQTKLWRVPIGGGPGEELPSSGLIYQWARPFRDGSGFSVLDTLPQQPLGLFIQSLETGMANPLTGPMMVRNASVSEDGSTVAILNPEGKLLLYATTGGQPRTIASKEPLAPIR